MIVDLIVNDLKAYRAKKIELMMLEDQKERLKTRQERCTAQLRQKIGVSSNVDKDKLLNDLIELERLEKEIDRREVDLSCWFIDLNDKLNVLNPDEQTILRLRYFEGLKWQEIAKKMNYSETHCWRIQMQGLKKLGEKM